MKDSCVCRCTTVNEMGRTFDFLSKDGSPYNCLLDTLSANIVTAKLRLILEKTVIF